MQTLRQLVAGTDFSTCAECALETAIELARTTLARVTVVHVCELGVAEFDDAHIRQCDQALSEIVAKHRRSYVEVTGVLRVGKPCEKLDNVAAEVGASLIAIGRHGAGHGPSAEIGSTAHRLVSAANRSVLTVACDFNCFDSEIHPTHHQ